MALYGYIRVSTAKQSTERQYRNIAAVAKAMNQPDIKFFCDTYTGTKMDRRDWNRLIRTAKPGDTIIFDSVSRMSRNAEEGIETYKKLYAEGIHLVFIKERHIDTDVYRNALNTKIPMTGTDADAILEGINKYLLLVAEKQIRIAFEQAEAEVLTLQERTREGIITAKANGKTIGRIAGSKYETKKSVRCKAAIRDMSLDFRGHMHDKDIIRILGIDRHTYYKYKQEMKDEEQAAMLAEEDRLANADEGSIGNAGLAGIGQEDDSAIAEDPADDEEE